MRLPLVLLVLLPLLGCDKDDTDTDTDTDTDVDVPLDGLGVITGQCGVITPTEIESTEPMMFRNAIDLDVAWDYDLLSEDAQTVWDDGSLTGDSEASETLSFDVLYRCELADLVATEKNIVYQDAGGKKTDILVDIDGYGVAISVTRAFEWSPTGTYELADAVSILDKKLTAIPLADDNVVEKHQWDKHILHVMADQADDGAADLVEAAWAEPEVVEVRGDAILLITGTSGQDGIVYDED